MSDELKPYRSRAERTRVIQGWLLVTINIMVLLRVFDLV